MNCKFLGLILALSITLSSGCKSTTTVVSGAYEFTDKGGQKHRIELSLAFGKAINDVEKSKKTAEGNFSKLYKELVGVNKSKGLSLKVSVCKLHKYCIIVDAKHYSVMEKKGLKSLYEYVKKIYKDKSKGKKEIEET